MSDYYFIHRLLAKEMDARLQIVNQIPQQIILAGADGDCSHRLLSQRYPQAKFIEFDSRQHFLDDAAAQRKESLWSKWKGTRVRQFHACIKDWYIKQPADWLWANLSIALENNLALTMQIWAKMLKEEGLLFFSHFGHDSLMELRRLLVENNVNCGASTFLDMHDLGDMLLQYGFYDPVMDTAKVVLEYDNFELWWQDMQILGLWSALELDDGIKGKIVLQQAWQQNKLRSMTLETLYGHAVKKTVLAKNEQVIQFIKNKSRV